MLQLIVPLPAESPRSQWFVPNVEVVINADSLSIAYFDANHNCQANKDEAEPELFFYGVFATPVVLNRASHWRFDNIDRKKVSVLVLSLRKVGHSM